MNFIPPENGGEKILAGSRYGLIGGLFGLLTGLLFCLFMFLFFDSFLILLIPVIAGLIGFFARRSVFPKRNNLSAIKDVFW